MGQLYLKTSQPNALANKKKKKMPLDIKKLKKKTRKTYHWRKK